MAIQMHNVKIKHRPGVRNKLCKYLSRYPIEAEEEINKVENNELLKFF